MRFRRADLPGILIATLAPAGMLLLILAGYQLWDHHGTPLLPTIAVHLAVGAGLLAAFTRYVVHWRLVGGLITALLLAIAAAIVLHRAGHAGTAADSALRLFAVALFLAVNLVIVREIVWYGVGPLFERRDARQAERKAGQT